MVLPPEQNGQHCRPGNCCQHCTNRPCNCLAASQRRWQPHASQHHVHALQQLCNAPVIAADADPPQLHVCCATAVHMGAPAPVPSPRPVVSDLQGSSVNLGWLCCRAWQQLHSQDCAGQHARRSSPAPQTATDSQQSCRSVQALPTSTSESSMCSAPATHSAAVKPLLQSSPAGHQALPRLLLLLPPPSSPLVLPPGPVPAATLLLLLGR